MDRLPGGKDVPKPGRMSPYEVALSGDDVGLVQSHPVLDPVAQNVGHSSDVVAEPTGDVPVGPASEAEEGRR